MNIKPNKWQLAIVFITICLLALSALPTLYKNNIVPPFNTQNNALNAVPTWIDNLGIEPIKLGLDLYGGVLFVIHVDSQIAQKESTQNTLDEIKKLVQSARLHGVRMSLTDTQNIRVVLNNKAAQGRAWPKISRFVSDKFPDLQVTRISSSSYSISWNENRAEIFRQELMQQSVSIMRKRIESLGITEASVQRQGKSYIRIEIPGIKDPNEALKIIGTTATLDVYAMVESYGKAPKNMAVQDTFEQNTSTFRDAKSNNIAVIKPAVFRGINIKNASAGLDENGMPLVNLVLDQEGGEKMSDFSKNHIGQAMVTVFSEYRKNAKNVLVKKSEVINVATVLVPLGNRFAITNMPSPEAAKNLANLIRAGSLNAPLSIVEQRTINPTLGKENVNNGFAALALGVGLTMLFMALWYRKLGLIANVSLAINLICLLGLMALLPGMVLTLPGIAGLVLTVGMAVDTNVLVFERLKHEIKKTKHINLAVHAAYKRAFSAILDANITTMICALILLSMGNGPVKGFAMTLSLGILTSLFSGVFVARMLTQLFPPKLPLKSQNNTASQGDSE